MSKDALYDWLGYNQSIFHHTHHFTDNKTALSVLKLLTDSVGDYKMFPIHFLILLVAIFFLLRKNHSDRNSSTLYIKSALTLVVSMIIVFFAGWVLKETLSFARPYCRDTTLINRLVAEVMNYDHSSCFSSTPSGHSLYITTFVISIWSILNKPLRITGIGLIFLISLSRVALGMHFPADVVYGVLMAATITIGIKFFADNILTEYTKRIKSKLGIN